MNENIKFKDVHLNLVTEKVGPHWSAIIDGHGYSAQEIGTKYNVNSNTVSRHLSMKTSDEFKKWLENRIELNSLGMIGTNCRLFKRNGTVCWAECLADATGCSSSYANSKLMEWEKGEIDCDELFNPYRKEWKRRSNVKKNKDGPKWGKYSNRKRDSNLKKLKKAGTWERKQPESDGFFSGSSGHVVAKSGLATFYRGD